MKKNLLFFFFFLLLFSSDINAQNSRYVIQLKDKNGTPFSLSNPLQYLTQRAIERREKYAIALDSTDLPVNPDFIDSIRLAGNVTILYIGKWMNQVYIKTTDANALSKISSFPFVTSYKPAALRLAARNQSAGKYLITDKITDANSPLGVESPSDFYAYGQGYTQIHMHNGEFLHNHGFRGEGKIISVTDAGFPNYLTIHAFDSIRANNQILDTWDFVSNISSVSYNYYHGTNCLSTIASNIPGTFVGTAPKTSLFLYRTEDINSEYPIEEYNWVAAAERADSLGVDVMSVSLGYNTFDGSFSGYTYNDMNGNTSIIARGVDIAAKKGILVVAAIGNEGAKSWRYLLTPSDADSVLAVGAVGTNGLKASFSSYGPSSDGQVKPDVAAIGANTTVANPDGSISTGSGTSFACPIIAGLASCLWQAFPEVNNMNIIEVLRKASSRYNNPNDSIGYGIPNIKNAFVQLIKQLHTQKAEVNFCKMKFNWSAKSDSTMNFVIERKLSTETGFTPLFTQPVTGSFEKKDFEYTDDLSSLATGINIQYRIKMNIASDTSFYVDSALISYSQPCITYTFTGNGEWTNPDNWANGSVPPDTLPAGCTILINPFENGECVLNKTQNISARSAITVVENKKFIIPGELKIQ